ncbi:unnamed protein product [Amoebophrya sp. A120]|nr:unnamed protein product [Amoebophrya sp. A120]|eukprot:GSA120T00011000001.1
MAAALAGALDYGRLTPPPGCRVVLALCVAFFILPTGEILACSPANVFDRWWLWTLCTTTYVHHELFSLAGGLLLGWRRFVRAENEHGTVGFLLWLLFVSAVIHVVYVIACHLVFEYFDPRLAGEPVHGLWPLVCLLFTYDAKLDPFGEVLLWPLPLTVYTRTVPLLALFGAWLVHFDAHLDSIVAMLVALALPFELQLSDAAHDAIEAVLERHESVRAVQYLKGMEGFCTRNAGFKALGTSGAPATQANEFDFAGSGELDLEAGAGFDVSNVLAGAGSSSSSSSSTGGHLFGNPATLSSPGKSASGVVASTAGGGPALVAGARPDAVGGSMLYPQQIGAASSSGIAATSSTAALYAVDPRQQAPVAAPLPPPPGGFASADFLESDSTTAQVLNTDFLAPGPAAPPPNVDPFLAQHPVFDENINTKDIFGDLSTTDDPFEL